MRLCARLLIASMALATLATLAMGSAWAQDAEMGDSPPRLLDVFQGPVISSGRVLGMGGAFTGVGEGADGHLANPVAFAFRAAPFAHDWFDYDFTASWLNLSSDDRVDFDQSGEQSTATIERAQNFNLGFNLKFGRHGLGVHTRIQRYATRLDWQGSESVAEIEQSLGGLGYATVVDADRLWLGALLYGSNAKLLIDGTELLKVSTASLGALFGALYAPPGSPWRVGATYRTKRWGTQLDQQVVTPGRSTIDGLVVPWQIAAGVSYMLGPRQYNVRPTFGEKPPPQGPSPRRYTLLSADLVLTGKAPDGALGLTSFATEDPRPSGQYLDIALRLGGEAEIVDGVLILRGGAYFEPDRFAPADGRLHLTGGWDIHIGQLIWDWEVSLAIDWAPDYLNWGLGVGLWY